MILDVGNKLSVFGQKQGSQLRRSLEAGHKFCFCLEVHVLNEGSGSTEGTNRTILGEIDEQRMFGAQVPASPTLKEVDGDLLATPVHLI